MKQLDPKYVWLYFINTSVGFIPLCFVLFFILSPFLNILFMSPSNVVNKKAASEIDMFISLGFGLILLILAVLLIINFVWAKLTYKYFLYELREDGIRIEHGVIWKKYVTIPYERIQNVDINRGLFARIFKLSDLQIQTAGMSSGAGSFGSFAEGRLPGLAPTMAEQLRDELVNRARGKQQTPVPTPSAAPAPTVPTPNQGM